MINTNENANFDAELMKDAIATGDEKKPKVNVEDDYERSKEYAVSDIDKTNDGTEAAEKATGHKFAMPEPEDFHASEPQVTGDPDSYREMAKDVNPRLQ